jgi:hypothetical protein
MSTEDKITALLLEVVSSMIEGGGEVKGLGIDKDSKMSMTDATEAYWGMSGRGNPNAKARIRMVSAKGLLDIQRKGRVEHIKLTDAGIKLYQDHQSKKS